MPRISELSLCIHGTPTSLQKGDKIVSKNVGDKITLTFLRKKTHTTDDYIPMTWTWYYWPNDIGTDGGTYKAGADHPIISQVVDRAGVKGLPELIQLIAALAGLGMGMTTQADGATFYID